ncbi:unnamed protein product [Nesidiocoris tenuis]|uniref:Uncharacterized protein n=1 Tax=Nesidiocoris tenuis TaxID=355587 RepID=A0A6H5GP83_9HEMI|nr:unnamed protein product [Nesidiocoris tenuis]
MFASVWQVPQINKPGWPGIAQVWYGDPILSCKIMFCILQQIVYAVRLLISN